MEGSLQKLTEQWRSFFKKLEELYETSASRSSDVNLLIVKTQVLAENRQRLETNIERSRSELVRMGKWT